MLVREVMYTGVLTVRGSEPVREVVTRMISRHCGAIPVVDDEGTLIGLVAVRDVLIPLYPNYGDYIHDSVVSRDFVKMESAYAQVLERRVDEVMTLNPLTVSPDDPVLKAASYMGLKNFRRIPVVAERRLVGMLSIGDINRELYFASRR